MPRTIAIARNGRSYFIRHSDSGFETTTLVEHAKTFTDQADIDAYVIARAGGAAGDYRAVALPLQNEA